MTELYCIILQAGVSGSFFLIFTHEPKIAVCLGRRSTVNAPFSLRTPDSALVSSTPPVVYVLNVCVRDESGGHREEACSGVEMSAH